MIGSLDVKALYTSINTKIAGELARDNVRKTKTQFKGVNYTWALKYLALTLTNAEKVDAKIQPILPRRISNKNNPPYNINSLNI